MARTNGTVVRDDWAVWAIRIALLSLVVFLPDGFSRWFLPKEVVLVLAVVVSSLATPGGRLPRFFWCLVAAGSAVLLLAALLGDAPLAQLMGRWPRYEGLVSLPVYLAAAWFGARMLGPGGPIERVREFYRSVSAVSVLLALVGIAETLGMRPVSSDLERPGALLGNATDQGIVGAVFAIVLALPLVRALDGRGRVAVRETLAQWSLLAGGAVGGVLSVILSASRAGALALAVGLVLLAAVYVAESTRVAGARAAVRRAAIAAGAAALIAAAALALPFTRDRLLGASDFAASSVGDRFVIWAESLRLLAASPLSGVGPSGYLDAIVSQHDAAWYARVGEGTVLDSPHSWPLQAAVAGGLPLLAVALVFSGYLLYRAFAGRSRLRSVAVPRRGDSRRDLVVGAIAALVAMAAALATHFSGAATGILIGLLVGIVVAVAPRPDRALWRRARTAIFGVWLVLLALTASAELPMQSALTATDARQADVYFGRASALRPWDADLASIAAQSMTARADSGDAAAAAPAIAWAERALAVLPQSVPTRTALGVAQRAAGELDDSVRTLADLADDVPLDATIAYQHAISLAATGDLAATRAELERALALRPGDEAIRAALDSLR
jgi:O-antigen ligase